MLRTGYSPRPLVAADLNVQVPATYMGFQNYKALSYDPSAAIGCGRSWGMLLEPYTPPYTAGQTSNWYTIENEEGVYQWGGFDAAMELNAAVPLVFGTITGTPDWAVAAAATGTSSGTSKSNQPPDDPADFATFAAAMVNRAKDEHGRTGMYWDLWNEIDYVGTWAVPGTNTALGPMVRLAAAAIRTADPAAKVLSPSIIYPTTARMAHLTNALAVSDGDGGALKDHLDGICMHFYAQDRLLQWYRTTELWNEIVAAKASLATAGAGDLPIYINEAGVDTTRILHKSEQPTLQLRAMLLCACAGIKAFCAYVYDGDPVTFACVAEYLPQWNDLASKLNGGHITRMVINHDQSVSATIDGAVVTV